jgi:Putative Actinobacterial Holin-X, holin superfamily III
LSAVAFAPHIPATRPLTLRDLLAQLRGETGLLLRDGLLLAKAELAERAGQIVPIAVAFGAALLFAVLAAVGVLAGGVLALAQVMPAWSAAFVVAGFALGCSVITLALARGRLRRLDLRPRETIRALKEAIRWLDQSK